MKKTMFGLTAGLALFAAVGTAEAQSPIPLAVEVRGGIGFPTGDLGDDEQGAADLGYGFGATGMFTVTPMFGVYAGYSRFSFAADTEELAGGAVDNVDVDYNASGFNAGVQASLPAMMGFAGAAPYLRGGVVYHKLEVDLGDTVLDDVVDDDAGESDYGLGFEVGGGLDIPLGPTVSVTPGVRYVTYQPDFNDEDETDVNYVAADVGLKIRF